MDKEIMQLDFFTDLYAQARRLDLRAYITARYGYIFAPNGEHSMVTHCPFHNEDHPTLTVSRTDRGEYYWRCVSRSCDPIMNGTIVHFMMREKKIGHTAAILAAKENYLKAVKN